LTLSKIKILKSFRSKKGLKIVQDQDLKNDLKTGLRTTSLCKLYLDFSNQVRAQSYVAEL